MSVGLDTDYLRRCEDRADIDQLRATIARQAAEIEQLKVAAIPEDVRETLIGALDSMKYVYPSSLTRLDAARRWLAQCPTATDKAVCPQCGDESYFSGEPSIRCQRCDMRFDVRIIVISPPRAPKVTG